MSYADGGADKVLFIGDKDGVSLGRSKFRVLSFLPIYIRSLGGSNHYLYHRL